MKLFSMKLPKMTKKKLKEKPINPPMDREEYPWGLRLNFGKKETEKIPALKNIAAGAKVKIQGIGKVIEVRTTDTDAEKGPARHNVEIQIQKIGIEDQSKTKEQIFNEAIK